MLLFSDRLGYYVRKLQGTSDWGQEDEWKEMLKLRKDYRRGDSTNGKVSGSNRGRQEIRLQRECGTDMRW
jgi:hypothetical protein